MKLRLPYLLFFAPLLAVLAACSGGTASVASETAPSGSPSVLAANPTAVSGSASQAPGPANHDGQKALAHVQALAGTIGERVAGTANEQKAAAYIRDQFQTSGYDVELMAFSYTGDRFRAGSLTIDGHDYFAITMDGSAGGAVTGPATFVGLGDDGGIAGRSLAGHVAVAMRGTTEFGAKYDAVKGAGAIGLVVINNQPGIVNGRLRKDASFPVVGLAGEDADAVRAAAAAGKSMTLKAAASGPSTATNVVARPSAGAHCDIVVGGHYDTVPTAPGANDNASGTANVIELARTFAADGGPKPGLCFAAFSAEESGLFGSQALVDAMKRQDALPKVMVNLDVTGEGPDVQVIGDASLSNQAISVGNEIGIKAEKSSLPANIGSDHMSFQDAGVPVLYFTSGDFAQIHTPQDTVGRIDAAELDRVGDLAFAMIQRLLPVVARG